MSDAVDMIHQVTKKYDPLTDTINKTFAINPSQQVTAPTAPTPPATTPEDIAARNEAARQQRIAASRFGINPTGGLGDTSNSGSVAKRLLGA